MKVRYASIFRSHLHNIFSVSFLVVINLFLSAVSFFTQIKIANNLGKENFGLLAYGLAIAAYGTIFIRYGLDRTMVRDLVHDESLSGPIIGASLLLRYGLLAVFIVSLLVWKVAFSVSHEFTWGLFLIIISNSLISMDLQPVYDSCRQINRHAMYNLIQRLLYFILVWFTILFFRDFLSILWISIFMLASVCLYLYMQHRWIRSRIAFDVFCRSSFLYVPKLLRSNYLIFIASFATAFLVNFNQILLKNHCGTIELGGYAAAWQIAYVAVLLMGQVARVGNPAMARITKPGCSMSQQVSFLIKYMGVMVIAVLPVVAICVAFPELIFKLLFQPEYYSHAKMLPYLGCFFVLYATGWVAGQYLLSSNNEKAYFISCFFISIASVISCVILIPKYKSAGAIYALIISYVVANAINWFQVIRKLKNERLANG